MEHIKWQRSKKEENRRTNTKLKNSVNGKPKSNIYLNFILASTFAKQDGGRRKPFIIHVSHLKVTKMQKVAVIC